MADAFAKAIQEHSGNDPSEEEQQRLGKPRSDGMTDEHAGFLDLVLRLIDEGNVDTKNPESFVRKNIYSGLSEEMQGKVDFVIPNLISLLERIMDLHARPEKDDSFEMKNLIETLWQAKERIEKEVDVFIF
jgi:hypothetical protein